MKPRPFVFLIVRCCILTCLFRFSVIAQPQSLNQLTYRTWPKILEPSITSNGLFVSFISKIGDSSSNFILRSTEDDWWREIHNVKKGKLMRDLGRAVYVSGDTVGIIELGTNNEFIISNAINLKISESGSGNWIGYTLKSNPGEVYIKNIITGEQLKYSNVKNYEFSKNGDAIFFEIDCNKGKLLNKKLLVYLDLNKGADDTIWHGLSVGNYAFNESGSMLGFFASGNPSNEYDELFYFKNGMDSAIGVVSSSTRGMEGMSFSKRDIAFNKDGNIIFFYIEKNDPNRKRYARDTTQNLIIWNWADQILYTDPPNFVDKKAFATSINLAKRDEINRLEIQEDDLLDRYFLQDYDKPFLILRTCKSGNSGEYRWRSSAKPDIYLVSVLDGSRTLLLKGIIDTYVDLSPSAKFAIWYDREKMNWFTYNIQNSSVRNVSLKINAKLNANIDYACLPVPAGNVVWLKGDSTVFIYDQYDIWKVDPNGNNIPVNMTNGNGVKNKVRYRFLDLERRNPSVIDNLHPVLISAFNTITKENGIIKNSLVLGIDVRKIKMYPKTIYFDYQYTPGLAPDGNYRPFFPLKAKKEDVYLVRIMDATNFPNLFITHDFEDYKALTDFAPEKLYNWYTNELVQWKLPSGEFQQGILYKPQNMDRNRKYPTIFLIYEKFSDVLNSYIYPHLSNGILNIPWFVSNGYLVFVPDITYKIGCPGESALSSILSSVKQLNKFPFFDQNRLGLQGISYGGYEVNYIVSHTNIFRAAAPAAGVSNLMSEAGQISNMSGKQEFYEERQGRIGATLWKRPDLYIKNSPIFAADKVHTPLLILHNTLDNAVNMSQSVEWFTSLRRLGRKAWMLQYIDENHSLAGEKNKIDFSIRLAQFFDYYLKNQQMPKWMELEGAY